MKRILELLFHRPNMVTIWHSMIFRISLETCQMLVTLFSKEMLLPLPSVILLNLILSKILLKTQMESAEFLRNKKIHIIYQKTHKIYQTLITITNRETFYQLAINMTHRAKLISKMLPCNQVIVIDIQLCSVNNNTFYQKMLKIFQTLITIINKETFYQLDINTIHKVKLIFKITIWHQIANTQLCLVNKKTAIIYQKMLKISQMLITITNRETFFPLVINMTHKAKLILKMLLCNQVIVTDIQLCSTKKKTKKLTSINITINTIIRRSKMNKKFKLVLKKKLKLLHRKKFLFQNQFQLHQLLQ